MAAIDLRILIFTCALLPACILCLPEAGVVVLKFDEKHLVRGFPKSLFKDATIVMSAGCKCEGEGCGQPQLSIRWKMKETQCAQDFVGIKDEYLDRIFEVDYLYPELRETMNTTCSSKITFPDVSEQKEYYPTDITTVTTEAPAKEKQKSDLEGTSSVQPTEATKKPTSNANDEDEPGNSQGSSASGNSRKRREETGDNPGTSVAVVDAKAGTTAGTTKSKKTTAKAPHVKNQVAVTFNDAIYLLIVKVEPQDPVSKFQLELTVKMKSKTGYLSAADWPLLPFYGVMSLVYLFFGIIWLVVSACQWRDLLRIQFWIGGVIALGMLEKAVFYSEYNDLNQTGIPKAGLVVFAELVSCMKRTLARILVIIVSMGFGIVKPRLGSVLHRVLGVGALYFILGSVEGGFRALSPKEDPSKQQLIANIPLAVLDAAICWWIFMSLVQTTRTLRIRRNLVKLSLYRHFTNTLIFAVLASVAYMIWSIKTHKFSDCLSDWSELWLDEAFWHFLFSLLLLVIMILWRPTANNQRYAFTPLVDFGDDDDEDNITLSEAFEGMKMRPRQGNGPEVVINGDRKPLRADDDLKWVEENIPTSAADAVLPSVLDSDEELMTTKFEMSKME